MHVAVAVGTPVAALFAVADSRMSGPYYDKDRHVIIQKKRTCNPCEGKSCKYQKCMENISVDEVFDALKSRIQLDPQNPNELSGIGSRKNKGKRENIMQQ